MTKPAFPFSIHTATSSRLCGCSAVLTSLLLFISVHRSGGHTSQADDRSLKELLSGVAEMDIWEEARMGKLRANVSEQSNHETPHPAYTSLVARGYPNFRICTRSEQRHLLNGSVDKEGGGGVLGTLRVSSMCRLCTQSGCYKWHVCCA